VYFPAHLIFHYEIQLVCITAGPLLLLLRLLLLLLLLLFEGGIPHTVAALLLAECHSLPPLLPLMLLMPPALEGQQAHWAASAVYRECTVPAVPAPAGRTAAV
jgi:hypothetical protein